MTWLILGAFVLGALLLGSNWLGRIDPAMAARLLRWAGIAALIVVAAYLALSGRIALDVPMLLFLLPQVRRWLSAQTARATYPGAPQPSGGSSEVRTATLHMTLDHASGAVNGKIVAGRFAGSTLAGLEVGHVLDLLAECRAGDPESVPLLEAYLDRLKPEWRENTAGRAQPAPSDGPMTRDEAYRILELEPDAAPDEIRAAHHRLMKKLHPDQGGSTYLASKVNQAKDLLLG